ncbi:unnamed protein product [Rotaria socialis]
MIRQLHYNRYVYEYINDEQQVARTLVETKTLLSQHQLRIYIVDSFNVVYFNMSKKMKISIQLVSKLYYHDISVPREIDHYISTFIFSCHILCWNSTSDFVHYLGESVRKDYSEQITYVISHANIGEKYLLKEFFYFLMKIFNDLVCEFFRQHLKSKEVAL